MTTNSSSSTPRVNISTAQAEYYRRPADERFETLDALIANARHDKEHSAERTYNLKDLRAVATVREGHTAPTGEVPRVVLESPRGQADFTHYSFGQLARTIGAPASYLRELPPSIAADCINHGLRDAEPGTAANLLIRANGGTPVVRAATSDTYGRVWDADLYGTAARYFGDGATSAGGAWQTPPAWPGSLPSGQYRGDRDSFVIRVDGGSIVNDPRARQGKPGGGLYRGIMVRNSEVGAARVTIECVLFDYICGNHMLWGAVIDRRFRRRHVGTRITRDTIQELLTIARAFNTRSASQDAAIIQDLVTHELAHTREAVIDELRKVGYSKQQADTAYDTCEQREPFSPRSYWGLAAGTTRASQESGYQDDRLIMDQLAAALLARGAKQYATA